MNDEFRRKLLETEIGMAELLTHPWGEFELTPTGLIIHGEPTFEEWEAFGELLRRMQANLQALAALEAVEEERDNVESRRFEQKRRAAQKKQHRKLPAGGVVRSHTEIPPKEAK